MDLMPLELKGIPPKNYKEQKNEKVFEIHPIDILLFCCDCFDWGYHSNRI